MLRLAEDWIRINNVDPCKHNSYSNVKIDNPRVVSRSDENNIWWKMKEININKISQKYDKVITILYQLEEIDTLNEYY